MKKLTAQLRCLWLGIAVIAIASFSHLAPASDACDATRLESLARIGVYSVSICLTVYELTPLDGGDVKYDVLECREKAKHSIAEYLGPCGQSADNKALASWPIIDYVTCKLVQMGNRAVGTPIASSGDDRDVCSQYALKNLAERNYQELLKDHAESQ